MMQITMDDYWMGRDLLHADELTHNVQANAELLVPRVNSVLILAAHDLAGLVSSPTTGSLVASGWRPQSINARTRGAARRSHHLTGCAVDLYDPAGRIDGWCMQHLDALESAGLWMEHPDATPRWCHLQSVPPKSGNRVFRP